MQAKHAGKAHDTSKALDVLTVGVRPAPKRMYFLRLSRERLLRGGQTKHYPLLPCGARYLPKVVMDERIN